MAERGIVPLLSIWLPHYRPVRGSTAPPGLDYYRAARQAFAELFARHGLEPPGASGLNVCMCRDLVADRTTPDRSGRTGPRPGEWGRARGTGSCGAEI